MAENNSKTKKTGSTALGKFFLPMWLLGICAFGAVVLCIFIFGWMINFEQRYAELQEHRDILASLPGLKQQQSEIQKDLDSKNEELRLLRSNIREKTSELNELIARKKEAELQKQAEEKLEAFSQELKQKLDSLSASVDSLSSSAATVQGAANKISSQGTRMEGDADVFSATGKKMQEKLTDLFNAVSENNIRQKTQDYNRAIENLEGSLKSLSQQMEAGKGSIVSMADSLRGINMDLQKIKKDLNDAARSAGKNIGAIPADLDKVQQTLQDQSLRLEKCLTRLSESASRLPSVSASQEETLEALEKLKKLLKENGEKQGDTPDVPQGNGSAPQKQE